MTPRPLRIVIDPGHGSKSGELPGDPGAVNKDTTESAQNLAVALALKFALVQHGHSVVLTRVDEKRPGWWHRTAGMGAADLYLSIHHDSANGRSMAYFAAGADYSGGPLYTKSKIMADALDAATPDPEFIVLPDSTSRFGRLYIRGALAPVSVLWEIDPLRIATRAERQARAEQLLNAIERARAHGLWGGQS